MKHLLIIVLFVATTVAQAQFAVNLPTYTQGVYSIDTICHSSAATHSMYGSVYFGGDMSDGKFITGITFKMVIDEIDFGQSPTNPGSWGGQAMHVGDTMNLPVDFLLTSGSIDFHIITEGVPEIANEIYRCDLGAAYTTGADYGMFIYPKSETTCSVLFTSNGISATETSAQTIVSPNPFSERASISFENIKGISHEFLLFDGRGNLVRNLKEILSEKIILEKSTLPSGIYHYQLRSNVGTVSSGSLVIE